MSCKSFRLLAVFAVTFVLRLASVAAFRYGRARHRVQKKFTDSRKILQSEEV